jgi:2-polyprenyl-3-methyl-5-hydroxy-6-metoxy-1,4-benzoquinol methylase
MKRTIEKLSQERREKEEQFAKKLAELKEAGLQLELLDERLKALKFSTSEEKKHLLASKIKSSFPGGEGLRDLLTQAFGLAKKISASVADILKLQDSLADARDKEWDALGNNHVGMIFKSMEWRVDKLSSEYADVKLLMKKFLFLKDQLNRLLALLEEKKMPSPAQVREVLEPIEDGIYTGFENRFRGHEEEIKKQQEGYVPYFRKGGTVLDLGCGRGEFLELLQKNGIQGTGVDSNSQMTEICLDKGLDCRKGDILGLLAEWPDSSLDGIFSSQVIEHLPPPYLKKLIDVCHLKLVPSGMLILETINPTSVFAFVQIYNLDLSHQKPVHPQALRFLMESAGFEDVRIQYSAGLETERLQNLPGADEASSILNRNIDRLNSLLYAAPNYAAIGRKK